MKQTKYNKKYLLGSTVTQKSANAYGIGASLLGGIAGDTGAGGFLSGAGSGIGLGASLGSVVPGVGTAIGAVAGGVIGGIGGLFGRSKKKKAEEAQLAQQKLIDNQNYIATNQSQLDTYNENPYGSRVFAKGGEITNNVINIEKGELQIDPKSGKILRDYSKINPETGGLYESHSKGEDTENNFVSATPGTFVITAAKAPMYKKAVDNNDKLAQNTILQNIKNAKDNVERAKKMALGSYVLPEIASTPSVAGLPTNIGLQYGKAGLPQAPIAGNGLGSIAGGLGSFLGTYGAPLANISQGLFGKVEQQSYGQRVTNPYLNQITSNLPQNIDVNSIVNEARLNNRVGNSSIDRNTNSGAIARANKLQSTSNLNRQIAGIRLQGDEANNQVRSQRASIYGGLGQQAVGESQRLQGYNFGVDQLNAQNRAAKSNLLTTGLGQLQQTYQAQNTIGQQKANDALKNKLLFEMFPNLRFYQETFGGQR